MLRIALLVALALQAAAQVPLTSKYTNYTEHNYKDVAYGLFKPTNYDPTKSYPLIVYLHGSNDLASRDMLWYQQEMQKQHPAFVITPKCKETNQGWGNTWTDKHTEATSKTLALVDSLVAHYKIDANRLYVYGISMGAFGVFSILQKEQGKFAAAFAICGGSDTKAASKLLITPLWIFHGAEDDIVPVRLSRNVYEEMIKLGATNVKYTEYPGLKHNSWDSALGEKTLPDWLFSKRKK